MWVQLPFCLDKAYLDAGKCLPMLHDVEKIRYWLYWLIGKYLLDPAKS